jgi:Vanillate O-demethylase oxygenase C-terminal domain
MCTGSPRSRLGAVGFDDPDYILGRSQLDYAAEARLINDNLLDFTHLACVHTKSFGVPEGYAYDRPKVIPLERGVRFERWTFDQTALPGQPATNPVERFSTYDFLLPGLVLIMGEIFLLGRSMPINKIEQIKYIFSRDVELAIWGLEGSFRQDCGRCRLLTSFQKRTFQLAIFTVRWANIGTMAK